MQLVREAEVELERPSAVFGHGRIGASFAVLFCAAFSAGLAWCAPKLWHEFLAWPLFLRVVAVPFGLILGGVWLLMCGVFAGAWRATCRPTNWVMKLGYDGVWVKTRSYLNAHFDDDGPTVAWIPWSEIAAVVPYSEVATRTSGRESTRTKLHWLDLQLRGVDTEELAALCLAERTRPAPERQWAFVKMRTRYDDEPVSVPRAGVVRLQRVDRRMEEALSRHVTIAESVQAELDLQSGDLDANVRALCRRGDRFGALALVRDRRGLSTKDARDYVDALERAHAA